MTESPDSHKQAYFSPEDYSLLSAFKEIDSYPRKEGTQLCTECEAIKAGWPKDQLYDPCSENQEREFKIEIRYQ